MPFRSSAVALAVLATTGLLIAPAAQASSRSVQVNGNQLRSALLPASAFGSVYQLGTSASSGGSLLRVPARGRISGLSCADFEDTPGVGTFGQTAYAWRIVANPSPLAGFPETRIYYAQAVVQFTSARAVASFLSQAYAKYAACGDFTQPVPSNLHIGGLLESRVLSISRTSIGAYPAFRVAQSAELTKIRISILLNTLAVVAGPDVFMIVSAGGTNVPVPASFMRALVSRVQQLR